MTAPLPITRSFKPRRRRLSPLRAERYARLAPQWTISPHGQLLDWFEVFGDGGPVVLDIGFGGGEALIELAGARPDERVVGVEVHTPGISNVLDAIDASGWHQVRVVEGDALELLSRVPPASLAGVRMFFPDPWPKRGQHHRRIVRAEVVAALVDRLAAGGYLHLATDITDYARHAQVVLEADPRLAGGLIPRPSWRPITRYERKAIAAGRTSVDLLYTRIDQWQELPIDLHHRGDH